MAKGKKIGKGTRNISVNMPERLLARLNKLAKRSKLSLSGYCRTMLEEAADRDAVVESKVVSKEKS